MEDDTFERLLRHMQAHHGMPDCFDPLPGVADDIDALHTKYHSTDPPGANFGGTAPPHNVEDRQGYAIA